MILNLFLFVSLDCENYFLSSASLAWYSRSSATQKQVAYQRGDNPLNYSALRFGGCMVFSNKSEMCSRDPIYSLYPCHYHVVVGCDIACSPALKDPEGFYGPKKGMSVSLPDEDGTFVMVPDNGCLSLILHFSEGHRIDRLVQENQTDNRIYVYKNAEQGGVVIVPNAKAGEWYRLIPCKPGSDGEAEYYCINESGVEVLRATDLHETFAKRGSELPFISFPGKLLTCPKEWVSLS